MQRMTIRTPTGAALEMADAYQSEDAARSDLMKRFRRETHPQKAHKGQRWRNPIYQRLQMPLLRRHIYWNRDS